MKGEERAGPRCGAGGARGRPGGAGPPRPGPGRIPRRRPSPGTVRQKSAEPAGGQGGSREPGTVAPSTASSLGNPPREKGRCGDTSRPRPPGQGWPRSGRRNLIPPCPIADGEDAATPGFVRPRAGAARPVHGHRLPDRLRGRRVRGGTRPDLPRAVDAPVPVSPPPPAVPSAGAATEGRGDEAALDRFYSAGEGVCDVTAVRGGGGAAEGPGPWAGGEATFAGGDPAGSRPRRAGPRVSPRSDGRGVCGRAAPGMGRCRPGAMRGSGFALRGGI